MSTDTNFMSVMDAHAQDRVSLESIKRAAERIKCHVHNTPIMTCSYLDSLVGDEKELFFKCENFQKTGSFKVSTITTFLWCKFVSKKFVQYMGFQLIFRSTSCKKTRKLRVKTRIATGLQGCVF